MVRQTEWRRPRRARVIAIRERLRDLYGRPVNHPHGHPIAELVRTILSQNTNDRNRDVAHEVVVRVDANGQRGPCHVHRAADRPQPRVHYARPAERIRDLRRRESGKRGDLLRRWAVEITARA